MKDNITPRSTDYSEWYLDVIAAADLAEHGPVRGTMIIKPYGFALWEAIQKYLDEKFKKTGVENLYFPMFIPESFLKREANHIEGFAPEVAVVTHAGGQKLEEPLIVRPTSETIMYDTFSRWIKSYRDLPLLVNQWCNVVRWEMRPRLFMRTTEFLWQEGHTAHATYEEADIRAREMLDIYKEFAKEVMALPVIPGEKSESEKFAGAAKTYTIEAMMQDGKALQFATSHNLGDNFAKVFKVEYTDENNEQKLVNQTSWGLSTRSIGGLIMAHSDDKGLVLPPHIAPIKAVIIPIWKSEETKADVLKHAQELQKTLSFIGKVIVDDADIRSGEKHFKWEKKGVPLRIEIGPRDIESGQMVVVRRDTGEKQSVALGDIESVTTALAAIQENLYTIAENRLKERTKKVDTWEEFTQAIEEGYFVSAHWSGDADVEAQIKTETKATIRCIPFDSVEESGVCIKSGLPSRRRVIFARAY